MSDDGRLNVVIGLEDQLSEGLNEMNAEFKKLIDKLGVVADGLDTIKGQMKESSLESSKTSEGLSDISSSAENLVGSLGRLGAAYMSLGAAKNFINEVFATREHFQDMESTMKTFLGSAEKGKQFFDELHDYAWFNMDTFENLTAASNQLIAYGNDVDDVIDIIDRLSNVASATQQPLMQYVEMWNKAKSTGTVDSMAMKQWQRSGLLIKDVLKEAGHEISGTTISFEQLKEAIRLSTDEGGFFNGVMDEMMQNISALKGQLEDDVTTMKNEIGEMLQGPYSEWIKFQDKLVNNYQTVGKAIAAVVGIYGAEKAAILVLQLAKKADAAGGLAALAAEKALTKERLRSIVATNSATKATLKLNAALLTNPYVALAAGIIAVVTALGVMAYNSDKVAKAHREMNDAMGEAQAQETAEISKLREIRQAMEEADKESVEYKKQKENLIALYGKYNKNLADEVENVEKVDEAYKNLEESISKAAKARAKQTFLRDAEDTKYQEDAKNFKDINEGLELAGKERGRLQAEIMKLVAEGENAPSAEDKRNAYAEYIRVQSTNDAEAIAEAKAVYDDVLKRYDDFEKKYKALRDKVMNTMMEESDVTEGKANRKAIKLFNVIDKLLNRGREYNEILKTADEVFGETEEEEDGDDDNQNKLDNISESQYLKRKQDEQNRRERERMAVQNEFAVRDARIKAMEDGTAKVLATNKLSHDKQMAQINQQAEDKLKALQEQEKAVWMKQDPTTHKEKDFVSSIRQLPKPWQDLYEAQKALAGEEYKKANEEAIASFGNFEQRFARLVDQIAKDGEGLVGIEKEIYDKETKATLAWFKYNEQKDFSDHKTVMALYAEALQADADKLQGIEKDAKEKANAVTLAKANMDYFSEYGDPEQQKDALNKYYEALFNSVEPELKKGVQKAWTEAIHSLDMENDPALARIFGNPAKMTRKLLQQNIAEAKAKMVDLAKSDASAETLKAYSDQIAAMEQQLDDDIFGGWGNSLEGVLEGLVKVREYENMIQTELAKNTPEGNAAADRLRQEQAAEAERLKKLAISTGANSFVNALQKGVDLMRQIAEISGDTKLAELAETLGGVTNIIGATASGAASDGWIGAAIGAASSTLNEITNSFTKAVMTSAQWKANMEKIRHDAELTKYAVDDTDFTSVFGTDNMGRAMEAYSKGQKALSDYYDYVDKLSNDDMPKLFEKQRQWWSGLAIPIFGGILNPEMLQTWNQLSNRESRELQGVREAMQKGYDSLQGMQIKTKDYGWFAELFGAQDQFTSLADLAPELWDENGELQAEKLKEFIQTNANLIDSEQRKLLENAVELKEAYDSAMKELEDYTASFLGNIADDWTNIIWDSIMSGEDALDRLQDSATSTFAAMGKSLLKNLLMTSYFNQFQDQLVDTFGKGDMAGAASIIDSMVQGMPTAIQGVTGLMDEYIAKVNQLGYDMNEVDRESTAKGVAQASQDSVNELNGRATAIQQQTFEMNETTKAIKLQNETMIANSGEILRHVMGLHEDTSSIRESIASMGERIDTMAGDIYYIRHDGISLNR